MEEVGQLMRQFYAAGRKGGGMRDKRLRVGRLGLLNKRLQRLVATRDLSAAVASLWRKCGIRGRQMRPTLR